MTLTRSLFPSCVLAAVLAACSGAAPTRFSDGDAGPDDSTVADAPATGPCAGNADCDDHLACTTDRCLVGGVCEHHADTPDCMPATRCNSAADCEDHVACTTDRCLVGNMCSHTAQNEMCPSGQTCLPTGCSGSTMPPATCRTDADCRDAYDCTVDSCGADGHCAYTAQNARCTALQVCRVGMGCIAERACSSDAMCDDHLRCNGTERCVEFGCVAGAPPSCDDTMPCTTDACAETGTMCSHTMNPTCMGGGNPRSGRYTISPGVRYMCVDDILGMVVVNINMTFVQITVATSGITVVGAPTTMMGGPIVGGAFRASGTVAGTCAETYTLTGMFTDDTHFMGTFSTQYVGLDCSFTTCENTSFMVAGTLAM